MSKETSGDPKLEKRASSFLRFKLPLLSNQPIQIFGDHLLIWLFIYLLINYIMTT